MVKHRSAFERARRRVALQQLAWTVGLFVALGILLAVAL